MSCHRTYVLSAAALLLLSGASASLAVDGVIEINQARALAGAVTTGDGPGFPVTLTSGGSYRLTSDLDVTVAGPGAPNTVAIQVQVSGSTVSIDLNGFSILGPNSCAMSCTNPGSGHGISGGMAALVRVRNGSIVGTGGYGVIVDSGLIENVTVRHSGSVGIFLNTGTIVHSTARNNGGPGLEAGSGSVLGSTSTHNLSDGIRAKLISQCLAAFNQGDGIEVSNGSIVDSVSEANGSSEANCIGPCALRGNHFVACTDENSCINGSDLQIPPGSNMCNSVVCPL